MKFISIIALATAVSAVALPGDSWKSWENQCATKTEYQVKTETAYVTPAPQVKYETKYETKYDTKYDTKYETKQEYVTVTQVKYETKYETKYDTKYDTKYETKYATVTKECEKAAQSWGNWNKGN